MKTPCDDTVNSVLSGWALSHQYALPSDDFEIPDVMMRFQGIVINIEWELANASHHNPRFWTLEIQLAKAHSLLAYAVRKMGSRNNAFILYFHFVDIMTRNVRPVTPMPSAPFKAITHFTAYEDKLPEILNWLYLAWSWCVWLYKDAKL